jgi:hypothetical protein
MELASIILNEPLANQILLKAAGHLPGFAASAFPMYQNQSQNITSSGKISVQSAPAARATQEEQHG